MRLGERSFIRWELALCGLVFVCLQLGCEEEPTPAPELASSLDAGGAIQDSGAVDASPDGAPPSDASTDSGEEDAGVLAPQAPQWRALPIRSEEEREQGRLGGEAEQHPHGITRSPTHPNVIYWSQDIAGSWRSDDGGESWRKNLDQGLWLKFGNSIAVDPVDPETVFIVVAQGWLWTQEEWEGLYRSRDGGAHWEPVLLHPTGFESALHRMYQHNIVADPSSVGEQGASRWYVAFHNQRLHRSEDGGESWQAGAELTGHESVYGIYAHPTDGSTLYLASSQGLLLSRDRGASFVALGDLPAGAVSSVQVHPQRPELIYASVLGASLYRSEDGGEHFSELRPFQSQGVFLNPGHPDTLYLVGQSENTIISHDGGQTWIEDMVTEPFPGLGRGGGWKGKIAGPATGIVPNPQQADEAVAFSRATLWKTSDGGRIFRDSSTGFTGFAWGWFHYGAVFDALDPQRFAFFNADVGMVVTENGGASFVRHNDEAWGWYTGGEISWIGAYAGSFQPLEGSRRMVAAIGGYWDTKLMVTDNQGEEWRLLEDQSPDNHFFISYHPHDPQWVYAGNKLSEDGGLSFQDVDFGAFSERAPSILGMCEAQPDTIYALSADRTSILRSDDRGMSWREYDTPGWRFRLVDSKPTFAVDAHDCDRVYALGQDRDLGIFDGERWRSAGVLALAGGAEFANYVRGVAVDPTRAGVLYANTITPGLSCIWRSVDGGESWQDITENFPRYGGVAMRVNPHTSELFIGSGIGTWIFPAPELP